MGNMTGERASSQANATCDGVRSFARPHDEEDYPRPSADQPPGKPRDEDDVVLLAVFQHVLRARSVTL